MIVPQSSKHSSHLAASIRLPMFRGLLTRTCEQLPPQDLSIACKRHSPSTRRHRISTLENHRLKSTGSMVNPHLLLPLLNSTLLSSSHFLDASIGCYGQNPPDEPQIKLITYKQCREVIGQIPIGEKGLAPVSFSRDSSRGYKVPDSWKFGNCEVVIDMAQGIEEEVATWAAILKRAFDIVIECVVHQPHLGGLSLLGANQNLKISVQEIGTEVGPDFEPGMYIDSQF